MGTCGSSSKVSMVVGAVTVAVVVLGVVMLVVVTAVKEMFKSTVKHPI